MPKVGALIAASRSASSNEPAYPYSRAIPNRKKADENAPSRKYFRPASWLSRRRRRAIALSRYSGSDMTSRATNIVSRSLAARKTIMPPRENSASGNTSECSSRAAVASSSCTLPGTDAAAAENTEAPLPSRRSANTESASAPNTSSEAHIV